MSVFTKVLRAGEGKKVRRLADLVPLIGALEPEMQGLSDDALAHKTVEFKERLDAGETLDDLLVEAYAVVREAAWRVLGQRHFDVQLMGGMALHFGWIAEMKTGEGKTLVSTLPAYLNALDGRGVHMVTVNEYLATRDAEWMGRVHRWLGLSVGRIGSDIDDPFRKRAAYAADITYGTNNEFGFDYLRDNMARTRETMAQRGHVFAIVDEVDSILIDEARTPLIISGPADEAAQLYYQFASIARTLTRDVDYEVDEEKKTVVPLEAGIEKVEKAVGVDNIYDAVSVNYVHQLTKALTAKDLYKKDKDYLVADGEVKIIDEFTGRTLEGRRWSDGLHQAVEAKERVAIKEENHTWATVTLQNYFRMYEKLSGMTGTAETEAGEFAGTYGLPVVPIPTNKEMVRADQPDLVFKTEEAKFNAVVEDIVERNELGQPMLIGTASVAKSELLSRLLDKRGVRHNVLNAKQHFREAEIVAQAGRRGAVTVATNMAGRGVDIILGGNAGAAGRARAGRRGRGPRLRRGAGRARAPPVRHRGPLPRRGRGGAQARRPLRPGQRAPREPPHRQPAAGPVGPPGRPGREPLLPEPRRRAPPPVRHRRHELGHGTHAARGRADRVQDGGQGDRAGAEHRRGPQRGDPQGRPQVRRGDGPAAQGHLRAPPADHRRRRPRGAHRGPPGRRRREAGGRALPDRVRGGLGPQVAHRRADAVLPDEVHGGRPGAGRDDRGPRRVDRRGGARVLRAALASRCRAARRRCARSSATSTSRSWTPAGGTTWPRWTTSRTASTCAGPSRPIPSTPGSRRATPCSASSWRSSTTTTCATSSTSRRCRRRRRSRTSTGPSTRRPRTRWPRPAPWPRRCWPSRAPTSPPSRPCSAPRREATAAAAAAGPRKAQIKRPNAPDPNALVPIVKEQHEKVGRNDPCWCGSGKKFKFCHGAA